MLKKHLLFSGLVVALFACLSGTALALTITPVRFEVSGDPGQTLSEEMTLVNETRAPQTYYASFANFEAQGDTGSPTFIPATDDLGTWMTTDVASINLAPGQQKVVPFAIHIPKDATPGGHFAALFWGTSPENGSGQITIGSKTGVLVLLSVNGDVKQAAGLVDFKTTSGKWFYKQLPVGFQYHFSNQGGDRVKPTGSLIIRSIFGWRVKKINANQFDGNVLPSTTRRFNPEWAKRDSVDSYEQSVAAHNSYSFVQAVKDEWHNFAFGIFHARLALQFGTNGQTIKSKNVYFVVFPWELLLVVIVIAIPLLLLLRMLVRQYNRSIIRKAQRDFTSQKEN